MLSLLTVLVLVVLLLVLVDPETAGLEPDPGPELDSGPELAAVGELAVGGVAVDPADPLSGGLRGPLLALPPARAELAVDLDEGLDDELEDSALLGSVVAATVLLAGVQMVAPSPSVAEVWKSEVRANMEPTPVPMKAAVTSVRRPNAPNRRGEGRGEGGLAAVVNCTRRRPGDSLIGAV